MYYKIIKYIQIIKSCNYLLLKLKDTAHRMLFIEEKCKSVLHISHCELLGNYSKPHCYGLLYFMTASIFPLSIAELSVCTAFAAF